MTTRSRRPAAGAHRCPACGAAVLTQADVIDIVADAQPIEPGTDPQIRGPNRLIWCRPASAWSTPRLRWIYPSTHPAQCPHPHHADHTCPANAEPTTLF